MQCASSADLLPIRADERGQVLVLTVHQNCRNLSQDSGVLGFATSEVPKESPILAAASHSLAGLLAVAWPLWDYVDTRALRAASSSRARLRYYRQLVLLLWAGALAACIISGPTNLFTVQGLGITTAWLDRHPWIWWALLFVASLFMLVQVAVPAWQGLIKYRERLTLHPPQLDWLRFFLPISQVERRWFAILAVSAGVCEEILCRGFLIRYLHTFPFNFGAATAILISVLIFGLHHVYQGVRGLLGSAVTGLVFTGMLLITGNLWLPIICHSLMDLSVLAYWRTASPVSTR